MILKQKIQNERRLYLAYTTTPRLESNVSMNYYIEPFDIFYFIQQISLQALSRCRL